MQATPAGTRPRRWCDTSAFVVRNGAEPAQPVAPKKAVAKPIDVPTSSRSRRYTDNSPPRNGNAYFEVNPSFAGAEEDGYEDDLQFKVDDLVSSSAGVSRAFSRAVYVPFAADSEFLAPRSALESKVEQLVSDFGSATVATATAAADPAAGLEPLAAHLRRHGLRTTVLAPPKPSARAPLSTRSVNAPFLMVTRPSGDTHHENADQAPKGTTATSSSSSSSSETIIIDAAVRDYLSLAPSTPAYEAALQAALPGPVFVGSRARLTRLVASLAPAIAAAFAAHGMEVPPWRRTAALSHRWSAVEERRRLLELQEAEEAAAVEEEGVKKSADVAAAKANAAQDGGRFARRSWDFPERDQDADGDLAPAVVLRPLPSSSSSSVWAAATGAAAAPAVVVPVVGFEVGAAAAGRVPWVDAESGVFGSVGSALFRRTSQAESDDGSASAYSEEAIMGMSPVSVFRAGLAPAMAGLCKGGLVVAY